MKEALFSAIHNYFDIVVRDAETLEEVQRGRAENIVLDRMYTKIANYQTYFSQIVFGTGTGELTPVRSTLFNRLGNKAATTMEVVAATPVSKWVRSIRLEAAEYNGQVLTEVGISETTTNINTHAMIKDAEGNNLSIEKLDTRIIDIYATVYIELLPHVDGNIWHTGIRNWLCGATTTVPNNNIYLAANYMLGDMYTYKAGDVSIISGRERKLSTRFNNYQSIGYESSKGMKTALRNLILPATHIRMMGVGDWPMEYNEVHNYDYTPTAAEVVTNAIQLQVFPNTFTIEEVLINGVATSEYLLHPGGEFNFSNDDIDYITVTGNLVNDWPAVVNNKQLNYGQGRGTSPELYSESGFDVLLTASWATGYYVVGWQPQVKDNPGDPWVSAAQHLYYEVGWSFSGPVQARFATHKKYLRFVLSVDTSAGSGRISDIQHYVMPLLRFNVPIADTDLITLRLRFINHVPKDLNYLVDASASVIFGEGV